MAERSQTVARMKTPGSPFKAFIVWPCGREYTTQAHHCTIEHHNGDVHVIMIWRNE